MNRSRVIAAGTSVGALVVLTAGVAVANPAARSSSTTDVNTTPSQGSRSSGDDSGWLGPDDAPRASNGTTDPNSGWQPTQPGSGSGSFDPGFGSGSSTRSGGS